MVYGPGAPPCCTGCIEYDRADGICRLLAEPSLEARMKLMTMPCNPQRLVTLRFRAYGEDVAREAVVAWLDPNWDPDDIAATYGKAPRDARLWLTSWPYLYLARNSVRRLQREGDRFKSNDADAPDSPRDPTHPLRVARTLERVHKIDPVGYAMLLDVTRDRFDAQRWSQTLGAADATVTDRKYIAIYRYAVYFHEVIESIQPHEAAVALVARRFSPGEPTEHQALESTRIAIGNAHLALGQWRQLYREGATRSLAVLSEPEALGAEVMQELGTAFRRVLRIEKP